MKVPVVQKDTVSREAKYEGRVLLVTALIMTVLIAWILRICWIDAQVEVIGKPLAY